MNIEVIHALFTLYLNSSQGVTFYCDASREHENKIIGSSWQLWVVGRSQAWEHQ